LIWDRLSYAVESYNHIMHILLSNDDGVNAAGIQQLAAALAQFAQVTVVAPDSNRSGVSNALTLDRPLSIAKTTLGHYAINGTPSDCVHVALTALMPSRPDLVVSGINNGQNMGEDTLYSGTVAAAMEGYLFGLPAIAFSLANKGWAHLEEAVQIAAAFTRHWWQTSPRAVQLLNVNIPNLPAAQHRGAVVARLGRRHASEPVIPMQSPQGHMVYWIGPSGAVKDAGQGTDFAAVAQGHTAVTPLRIDLTDTQAMPQVAQWLPVEPAALAPAAVPAPSPLLA
jgi:5'-nucleotidase